MAESSLCDRIARLMPSLKPDCSRALQRKTGVNNGLAVGPYIICSPVYGRNIAKYGHVSRILRQRAAGFLCSSDCVAERVGFEPTLPFRVNTLSKRAPSATRPSLRETWEDQLISWKRCSDCRVGENRRLASFHSMGHGRISANVRLLKLSGVGGWKTSG